MSYKKFNTELFLLDLQEHLHNKIYKYQDIENNFKKLIFYEPIINRICQKHSAVMKRCRLKNIANKTKLPEDMVNYWTQRNLVVKLNENSKKPYFNCVTSIPKVNKFWNIYISFG